MKPLSPFRGLKGPTKWKSPRPLPDCCARRLQSTLHLPPLPQPLLPVHPLVYPNPLEKKALQYWSLLTPVRVATWRSPETHR